MINLFVKLDLVSWHKKVQISVLQTFAYGYVWIKVFLTYLSIVCFTLLRLKKELSNIYCDKLK